jgi:hypothetical protein
MRSNLLASKDVIEHHITDACSNLGIKIEKYNINKLSLVNNNNNNNNNNMVGQK